MIENKTFQNCFKACEKELVDSGQCSCFNRMPNKVKTTSEGEFKWDLPKRKGKEVSDGDLRIVNLPVQVIFEWSDKIVMNWDEDGSPLEYTSGYIMKVVPDQTFIYEDQISTFLASTFKK